MARASGYSSFGWSARSSDRLLRMAFGTYHTDHRVDKFSFSNCRAGNSLSFNMRRRLSSVWDAVKSVTVCRAAD